MKAPALGRYVYWLDCLALLGVSAVLWLAFVWQLRLHELPCPLCLLQRVAFAMVGVALLMNLRFGIRPLHYGIAVLSALAGTVSAGRQVLLHIAPGDTGFGSPFLGLHLYTWALLAFLLLLVYCGLVLLSDTVDSEARPRKLSTLARIAAVAFLSILMINLVSTTVECGFGPCPDNPTDYKWLPK
ncbi:disulfide bond formation protein B [Microbulbifer donghaiensis]|uniref:disulfide bond formation protein B n=1 Tax=Microbulbifer donghaiensis TaxID=494016 RepID=UPI00190EA0CA|nr:disulfide bond formation protein B [Microbulbifer donghaiensis]